MTLYRLSMLVFFIVAAVTMLEACAPSRPMAFYLLEPVGGDWPGVAAVESEAILRIGRIRLPEYLDRPQMVVHAEGHRLRMNEFHRWGEPLKDNFARVLAENLEARLASRGIGVRDREHRGHADFELALEVLRFDAEFTGVAVLKARWTLVGADGTAPQAATSEYQVPFQSGDVESRVAAQSALVGRLADAIAGWVPRVR